MEIHCRGLCHWLASQHEIQDHHRCLPWKAILAVNDRRFAALLRDLESEWRFIQKLDRLPSKSDLFQKMAFTRWQCVQELLVEAECLERTL